ncbi:MAG: hypothetical protein JWO22_1770 [Frankiales bacterium]|nr:hypothetical protein [Frankiales bacterium]
MGVDWVRRRHVVLIGWLACCWTWLLVHAATDVPDGADWLWFRKGAQWLFTGQALEKHKYLNVVRTGGGLHLYALHPEVQIGPLSLTVTALIGASTYLAAILGGLLFLPTIRLLESAALHRGMQPDAVHKKVLAGGLLLVPAWAWACAWWRHLDDLLVVFFAALAFWAIATRRPVLTGVALAAAVAAKPTALVLLPLALVLVGAERRRAVAAAVVGCCLVWLPFVIADPRTLKAGAPQVPVTMRSPLVSLGFTFGDHAPSFLRIGQLAFAALLTVALLRRGHWWSVPAAAFAARLLFDPGMFSYYGVSLVALALFADLQSSGKGVPRTALSWLVMVAPFAYPRMLWPPLPDSWVSAGVLVGLTLLILVLTMDRPWPSARRAREPEPLALTA